MVIENDTDTRVSWFCYNSTDVFKWIALGSGNLEPNGGQFAYEPPDNGPNTYFVRFTHEGGGLELAGGIVNKDGQKIALEVTNGGSMHAIITPI
jgi:hypothetical protein